MNKLFLVSSLLLLVAVHAAFLTTSRVTFRGTTKHNVAQSPVDWMQESDMSHTSQPISPSNAWVKESSMYQAVECAEEECDVNEMNYHVSSLMQLDDECLFHQAFESEPTIECSNTQDRHLVQRILQLKHELHSLQEELKDNAFAKAVKNEHEQERQNHWYNDYINFYHM